MLGTLVCLALILAPSAPSAILPNALQEEQQLLKEVQQEQWEGVQDEGKASHAELRLATLAAALLSQPPQAGHALQQHHVQQLRRYITQVSRSKVDLDTTLRNHNADDSAVLEALQTYLSQQESIAKSLGLESAEILDWAPFTLQAGDLRSQLEALWSRVSPLVTDLSKYLNSRQNSNAAHHAQMVIACAATGHCDELVKLALPYPDTSNAVADLLRQKRFGAEQLAQLADSFLQRLGLPRAPAQLWSSSSFSEQGDCDAYADAEKVRLCAAGNLTGLHAALEVMTDSAYWRAVAALQQSLGDEPFPGFRRSVSQCVVLLAMQPQTVQQLVYGYHTEETASRPVSLYLARGVRSSTHSDPICGGDIGCQMTANWLMQSAVSQLLPLGYHMASLHWLQEAPSSPVPFAAWRRHMQHTLGVEVAAGPGQVDPNFYSTGNHISAVLTTLAAFQLHQAACPTGADCVSKPHAGDVIRSVMQAGASQPWEKLLGSVSGTAAPTAAGLVQFFEPLKVLMVPAVKPASLRTMELDDEDEKELPKSVEQAVRIRAATSACSNIKDADKTDAEKILCDWNTYSDSHVTSLHEDVWNMAADVTNKNDSKLVEEQTDYFLEKGNARTMLLNITEDKWIKSNTSKDELELLGEMMILKQKQVAQADEDQLKGLFNASTTMYTTYIGLMVCPFDNKNCKDEEKMSLWDLQQAMSVPQGLTPEELSYYWEQYRSTAKDQLAGTFSDYVKNGNKAASDAGLKHYGELWLQPYGGEAILSAMAATWQDVEPVYKMLHSFVRFQLKKDHESEVANKDDPLPSHLLGDMFAETWINIYNSTKINDTIDIDITEALQAKNYSVIDMTHDANTFFTGMGLQDFGPASFPDFQANSDLTADSCTENQDCQPLAWADGTSSKDIRLRMVNTVDMNTFEIVHNKMAALQYYVQYMNQDPLYRAPVNPAVGDAVAGALSLSVLSPSHLKSLGLIGNFDDSFYDNFLYRRALQYMVPMPFDFVTQTWRWEVFNGTIDSSNWEHRWWTLREDYQGVRPAVRRGKSDADPLAVPSVARDQPAFQRYLATMTQFQLFEFLCSKTGQYDPDDNTTMLAACDLTGQKAAGDMVKQLMSAGRTLDWQDLLDQYTLTKNLSSLAMLHYFQPLASRLEMEIQNNGLTSGWVSDLGKYWEEDDDDDNTVPIVVGVVLGVFVLIVLVAYFVVRIRRSKEE